eukprot:TRINITY_DN20414_c0_g1_i1.p1 TRINITY_DN20414_c0_g1~~TRINITY_DN20414_c0_g1_i1.p1  ORF type:complete len:377 (+),score=117.85 TRINITY_DN20414_c0_g1_i1:82-1212(+)
MDAGCALRPVSGHVIAEALQCIICCDLMRCPVSLPCGHSFCRTCILQALRMRKECPTCRRKCYTVTDPQPNVALATVLCAALPAGQQWVRAEEPPPAPRELPVFHSTSPLLPLQRIGLHLFEPRYRLLTRRALDAGGEFLFMWAPEGPRPGGLLHPDPAALAGRCACIAAVTDAHSTPDGRWFVDLVGRGAVQVQESWVEADTGSLYMARLAEPGKLPDGVALHSPSEELLASPSSSPAPGAACPTEPADPATAVAWIGELLRKQGCVVLDPVLDGGEEQTQWLWEAVRMLRPSPEQAQRLLEAPDAEALSTAVLQVALHPAEQSPTRFVLDTLAGEPGRWVGASALMCAASVAASTLYDWGRQRLPQLAAMVYHS